MTQTPPPCQVAEELRPIQPYIKSKFPNNIMVIIERAGIDIYLPWSHSPNSCSKSSIKLAGIGKVTNISQITERGERLQTAR